MWEGGRVDLGGTVLKMLGGTVKKDVGGAESQFGRNCP